MNLTIGVSNKGQIFQIQDYDTLAALDTDDLKYLLEIPSWEIDNKIFHEFKAESIRYDSFYFRKMEHAKAALEWIENIVVANKLAKPEKKYEIQSLKEEIELDDLWS